MGSCFRDGLPQLVTAILAAGTLLVTARVLQAYELDLWPRILLGLAPAPFFALLLWAMVRGVRRLDELQRKIMLDSLAIGFAGGLVFTLLYDHLAERAGVGLPEMDNSALRALLVGVWIAAYAIAASRYR